MATIGLQEAEDAGASPVDLDVPADDSEVDR